VADSDCTAITQRLRGVHGDCTAIPKRLDYDSTEFSRRLHSVHAAFMAIPKRLHHDPMEFSRLLLLPHLNKEINNAHTYIYYTCTDPEVYYYTRESFRANRSAFCSPFQSFRANRSALRSNRSVQTVQRSNRSVQTVPCSGLRSNRSVQTVQSKAFQSFPYSELPQSFIVNQHATWRFTSIFVRLLKCCG
jgi:hypothetical protein